MRSLKRVCGKARESEKKRQMPRNSPKEMELPREAGVASGFAHRAETPRQGKTWCGLKSLVAQWSGLAEVRKPPRKFPPA